MCHARESGHPEYLDAFLCPADVHIGREGSCGKCGDLPAGRVRRQKRWKFTIRVPQGPDPAKPDCDPAVFQRIAEGCSGGCADKNDGSFLSPNAEKSL